MRSSLISTRPAHSPRGIPIPIMAATMNTVSLRATRMAPAASSSASARPACPARATKLSSAFTNTERSVFMGSSQGLRAATKGVSMRPQRQVTTCAAKGRFCFPKHVAIPRGDLEWLGPILQAGASLGRHMQTVWLSKRPGYPHI